jgi:hypothetical protein
MASSPREFAKELVQALIKWTALEVSSLTEEDVIEPLIAARDTEIAREAKDDFLVEIGCIATIAASRGERESFNLLTKLRDKLRPPAPAASSELKS